VLEIQKHAMNIGKCQYHEKKTTSALQGLSLLKVV